MTCLYDFKQPLQEHLTNFFPFSSCIWNTRLGIVNAEGMAVKMYKLYFCRVQLLLRVQTLVVAGFLFLISVSANAATWYVDNTATGANNGTSWANAWTALSQASGAAAGDTVYISGGPSGSSQTYSIGSAWAPKGGTSTSRITYQIGQDSAHNGTVIFSGTGSFISAPSNANIVGDAGDGQQHFAVTGCTGIAGGSFSNLRIGYVNFGVMIGSINGACMYAGSVNGLEFDHNYVYQNNVNADAILHVDGFTGNNYDQSQIHDNTLYTIGTGGGGLGSDGMVFSGTGFTISNNVEICIGTNRWNSGEGQHSDGWQTSGGSYIRICNNFIWGFTDIGLYGGCWGSANNGLTYFSHVRIFNNVIDGGAGQQDVGCIEVEADNQTGSTFSDIGIFNNFCRVPTSTQGWGLFIGSSSTTGGTWSNVWATNNFIVAPTSGQRAYIINATVSESLNPWYTDAQAATMMANFVAGKYSSDYHLSAGATALIGKGANLYAYATIDKDGNPRPATGAWDIGAYAYGSVNNSTNPVIFVSPSSLDFGTVLANTSTNLTLTVQNTGGGTLTGSASMPAPFQIISGGSYSLGSNQTQTVTIGFNPTAAGTFNQTATFTGGNGASVGLTGIAVALQSGLAFSASAGSIVSPFTVTSMTPITINGLTVSSYISQAGATGLSGSGEAIYGFNLLSAGNYVVSAIVNTPSTSANSFYVNIDGQPTDPTMIWDPPVTSGFTDLLVSWRGTGTDTNNQFSPQVFNLTAGPHQLIVRGREGGAQLAGITIAPYAAVPPAPTGLHVIGQ